MPLYIRSSQLKFMLAVTAALSLLLIFGCSKGGGNSLHLKSPATGDKDVAVKSCYTYAVIKTFTDINGKMTTAPTYNFSAANYDLDATNFGMTLDKPMTSDDNVRVMFSLVAEEGKGDAPLKTGTYSAKADKYMKVESVGIVSHRGGSESKTWLDRSALNGQVKVDSVSADSVSGDIDVTAGDTAIKGAFTAKILKRK
jgi:hypothetical protein